jgi:hypothetical protein
VGHPRRRSSRCLASPHAGDEEADSGSANFYLDAARREGDRIAAMTVAALRDVFGVPHPAFLDWPSGEGRGADECRSTGAVEGLTVPDEPLAVTPESAEHLRELVAAALTAAGEREPQADEDGDIPLPMGSALVFVRVSENAPVVEMFAFVVRGIEASQRAAFEVAVLNRDTRLVKFVLLGDAVLATVQLPAMPFAPRQLRAVVSAMGEIVDRVDDDLVARLGGRRGMEPEPGPDGPEAVRDVAGLDETDGADEDDEGRRGRRGGRRRGGRDRR